ncbi:hemin uptake protein HemP [Simplicispira hankyongi]|nr:hemin uptake protein HemP [Burkholderiales bacterium]
MPTLQTLAAESPDSCATATHKNDSAMRPTPVCSNTAQPCFTWQSAELLQGNKRVHIAHNGGVYQLQATRQGKLILTK